MLISVKVALFCSDNFNCISLFNWILSLTSVKIATVASAVGAWLILSKAFALSSRSFKIFCAESGPSPIFLICSSMAVLKLSTNCWIPVWLISSCDLAEVLCISPILSSFSYFSLVLSDKIGCSALKFALKDSAATSAASDILVNLIIAIALDMACNFILNSWVLAAASSRILLNLLSSSWKCSIVSVNSLAWFSAYSAPPKKAYISLWRFCKGTMSNLDNSYNSFELAPNSLNISSISFFVPLNNL